MRANSTANLIRARLAGDASYNGSSAIAVYYTQARNELASANFIVPYTQALLSGATANFSVKYSQAYFQSSQQTTTGADGNVSAILEALGRAPQTIANPVGFAMINLRPYT